MELHKVLKPVANVRRHYGITPRQEEFARLYASGNLTIQEAARRAGYSETTVLVCYRLLQEEHYPKVVKRVEEIREALAHRADVTFENHVNKMAEIRDAAMEKGNFTAAVAAEKARGQAAGLYVSRSEILVGKIDQMSREEVLAEIKRIQSEFPLLVQHDTKPILDLTPVNEETHAETLSSDYRDEDVAELEEEDA